MSSGRQNGQGLSPKTVQDILVIIKDTVSFALIHGMQLPCKLERLFVKQKTSEIRVFTQEEQRKLTVFLMNDMNINKLCMLLCLYTGLRIGEVCALRWDCVDLDKRALRVRATVQRVRLQDPGDGPKTKCCIPSQRAKPPFGISLCRNSCCRSSGSFKEILLRSFCQEQQTNTQSQDSCSIGSKNILCSVG